jgi:alkanesulfonate monooxygenase
MTKTKDKRLGFFTRLLDQATAGERYWLATEQSFIRSGSSAVYFVSDPEEIAGNVNVYRDEAKLSALILSGWPLMEEAKAVSRLLLPRLGEIQ